MIDIENQIYTMVRNAILAEYPKAFITSYYVRSPASFPAISFEKVDTYSDTATRDSGSNENYAVELYEVNIYSNDQDNKKSICKEIAQIVDDVLTPRNFNRTMLEPIPNELDSTIYRLTGRYQVLVSKDNKTYWR